MIWVPQALSPTTKMFPNTKRKILPGLLLGAAVVAAAPGCATKAYVNERLANLEARQDAQELQIAELSETSRQALERATDAGLLAQGKFLYRVVYEADGFSFATDKTALSNGAQTRLNDFADQLLADNRNVYLEIQGHTDATGPAPYNQQLGLARAEAVRRHLHAEGVALDRMATISYGEEAPVAPNETADGRARNRRVEIVVLE